MVLSFCTASTVRQSYIDSGLMRVVDSCQMLPWHLQLVLDTSPLGQLLPLPSERRSPTSALQAAPVPAMSREVQSIGCSLIGSLPLQPLAHMLASLALQPISALLLLATALVPAANAAPTPVLSPLDMCCYCGGPARKPSIAAAASNIPSVAAPGVEATEPASTPPRLRTSSPGPEPGVDGPPCSYWSGHQCAGTEAVRVYGHWLRAVAYGVNLMVPCDW